MDTALIILGAIVGIYIFLRVAWWLVRNGAGDSSSWGNGCGGSL